MNQRVTVILVGVLVTAVLLLGWRMWTYVPEAAPVTEIVPEAEIDPSNLSLFSSGTYGVSFFYPAESLSAAEPEPPVVGVFTTGSTTVRVLAVESSERCEMPQPAEQVGAPATTSPMWSVFIREAIGTENKRRITQYRMATNDSCFVIEESRPITQVNESLLLTTILQGFTIAP